MSLSGKTLKGWITENYLYFVIWADCVFLFLPQKSLWSHLSSVENPAFFRCSPHSVLLTVSVKPRTKIVFSPLISLCCNVLLLEISSEKLWVLRIHQQVWGRWVPIDHGSQAGAGVESAAWIQPAKLGSRTQREGCGRGGKRQWRNNRKVLLQTKGRWNIRSQRDVNVNDEEASISSQDGF